jgi:Domain of unknown function (DUF397)
MPMHHSNAADSRAAGLSGAVWKKSSRSNGNGGNNCVEVAQLDTAIAVRDSKNPSGPALIFGSASWTEFLNSAKHGEFDINS